MEPPISQMRCFTLLELVVVVRGVVEMIYSKQITNKINNKTNHTSNHQNQPEMTIRQPLPAQAITTHQIHPADEMFRLA